VQKEENDYEGDDRRLPEVDIGDLEGEALAETYAECLASCDGLEAILDRHERAMAKLGLDFADTDLVIVDRDVAVAWLGERGVGHLERALAALDDARTDRLVERARDRMAAELTEDED
jgi:hypothetical protein